MTSHTLFGPFWKKSLQSVTYRERSGNFKLIITKMTEIAKWGRLLRSATRGYFKSASGITRCDNYYKVTCNTAAPSWNEQRKCSLLWYQYLLYLICSENVLSFLIFEDFLPFKRHLKHLISFSQVKYNMSSKRTTFARLYHKEQQGQENLLQLVNNFCISKTLFHSNLCLDN